MTTHCRVPRMEQNMDIPEGPKYAYIPGDLTRGFYAIEKDEAGGRYRYVWTEEASHTPVERGRWCDTRSAALRDAADNWDEAGSGERLAATLRVAATRAAKKEQSA